MLKKIITEKWPFLLLVYAVNMAIDHRVTS